jgi:hypothetical protein
LSKLYNPRVAEKIVNLFDFVNPLDLIAFCKQVEEIFLRGIVNNPEGSGKHLKMLAF